MKLFNSLLYAKKRVLVYLLIYLSALIIWFIYLNKYTISCYNAYSLSVFDLMIPPSPIQGGIFGKKSIAMSIVIVFILLIISVLRHENEIYTIVRQKSRENIWKNQSKKILIISFLYSIIVVLMAYLISGIMLGDFTNTWGSKESTIFSTYGNAEVVGKLAPYLNTGFLLGIIFLALFIGLTGIGLLIAALRTRFKNQYIVLTIVGIIFYEIIDMNHSIIVTKMAMEINNFLEPKVIVINFVFLILLSVISYICGRESIVRKDFFYNKK